MTLDLTGLRVHMSKSPVRELRNAKQPAGPEFKPNGLWYACGDEWIDWVDREYSKRKGEYLYSVILKPNENILFIGTEYELLSFESEYRAPIKGFDRELIDWSLVAKNFKGIEICPYWWSQRSMMLWYYTWDVASGCIWDVSAIAGLELLKAPSGSVKMNPKKAEEVTFLSGDEVALVVEVARAYVASYCDSVRKDLAKGAMPSYFSLGLFRDFVNDALAKAGRRPLNGGELLLLSYDPRITAAIKSEMKKQGFKHAGKGSHYWWPKDD